ncbi:class I SAM-dependent methyltransferase [Actinophytocola sp.]|uniref:class I SAM-dependent methyltransferase n=1 Tax=Actinophytocola sp. TaxID=1872138 RepID=UPI002ED39D14
MDFQTPFDSAYKTLSAPWFIGGPQPAVVDLEREGWITGSVLDAGCGMGEHTIHLARLGYEVLGVDFSSPAVEAARGNAARQGVAARFEVADVLDLADRDRFDTVVDSALFHVFGPAERDAYTRSLHAVCRAGAYVHVLALSDVEPGLGPQISDSAIRDAFRDGWVLEDLRPSSYRVIVGPEDGDRLNLTAGQPADMTAWLARARKS